MPFDVTLESEPSPPLPAPVGPVPPMPTTTVIVPADVQGIALFCPSSPAPPPPPPSAAVRDEPPPPPPIMVTLTDETPVGTVHALAPTAVNSTDTRMPLPI